MKHCEKKLQKIAITISVIVILAVGIPACSILPKPPQVTDSAYDLSRLSDGAYTGICDNGLVRVQVEVDIQNHTMAAIRIVEHQNGMGSAAESVISDVLKHQSIEVNAVSGATMSSQTILKSVENALSQGMEESI